MSSNVVCGRRDLTLRPSSPSCARFPCVCSSRCAAPTWFLLDWSVISRALYDKRISQEVDGEALGDEFAGYVSAAAINCSIVFLPLFIDTTSTGGSTRTRNPRVHQLRVCDTTQLLQQLVLFSVATFVLLLLAGKHHED